MKRLDENPLLTPADVGPAQEGLSVSCVLNPAAVRAGDQVILLVRVGETPPEEPGYVSYLYYDVEVGETKIGRISRDDADLRFIDARKYSFRGRTLLTSISHLHVARSTDGPVGRSFAFDTQPAIFPSTPYECYGCEDARITHIDGRYYITYTTVSDRGVAVALASTEDFRSFARHGLIFPPYQKDVVIFPEKIRGMYVCRHRPYKSEFNDACIWTAYSPDLLSWGRHEMTLAPRPGTWEADRVGCGPTPIRTDEGWLEIYHASDAGGRYCLGAMLSGLDRPERVVRRGSRPVLEPQTQYELAGLYGNCVFSNGAVEADDGALTIYYGAADKVCAAAVTTKEEMIAAAKR
ncbi:MAG: glycoside hydrolase family 130 protein [Planctomycetota bacterium]|jgi:predicted GH43/DUF377 family glycosyl hydrolase